LVTLRKKDRQIVSELPLRKQCVDAAVLLIPYLPGAYSYAMLNRYIRNGLEGLLLAGILSTDAGAADHSRPFDERYVKVDGIRLHCVTAGKGPLILFLHGFPEFWYEWKNQLREFGKDHLAVAPDLPGYNLSDKPSELDQYRSSVLVEDIRKLADHFRHDKKFILVGHDWGGGLAWAFAIAHPDYLQKLIIINAPHPAIFGRMLASDPQQQEASQYMFMFRSSRAEAILSADNYASLVEHVLDPLLKTGALTEADKAAYLKAWSRPGALTGGLNYYRANHLGPPAPLQVEAEIGPSTNEFGPDPAHMIVKVPTLVIWGEKDTSLVPRNLDGLSEFVPQLTIRRVPHGSHWVIHEEPAEVNDYIRAFIQ
jgi:epoxide hydrolase 4